MAHRPLLLCGNRLASRNYSCISGSSPTVLNALLHGVSRIAKEKKKKEERSKKPFRDHKQEKS